MTAPEDPVSLRLGSHYGQTFARHGICPEGVDWGRDGDRLALRYDKMLDLVAADPAPPPRPDGPPSLLDVGCGYAGLRDHALQKGIDLRYRGIDMAPNLVAAARMRHPAAQIDCGDVLALDPKTACCDYVVCNGILTQKLDVSRREMDQYARRLIRQLFALATRGVAFNVMTSHVNFFADTLYYREPAQLLGWCMEELTTCLRLDHAYPLYEFTLYLYRAPA